MSQGPRRRRPRPRRARRRAGTGCRIQAATRPPACPPLPKSRRSPRSSARLERRGLRNHVELHDGASVEEIVERAGYSHGAVYSNFAGKEDLFLAVFEEYMAERARELAATQAGLDDDAPLEARARALADQWMERFAADRESFLLHLEFLGRAGREPGMAKPGR